MERTRSVYVHKTNSAVIHTPPMYYLETICDISLVLYFKTMLHILFKE